MWAFLPAQLRPFFHTTAYPTAPFSSRDPSVQSTSPGWEAALLASCSAYSASAMEMLECLPGSRTRQGVERQDAK